VRRHKGILLTSGKGKRRRKTIIGGKISQCVLPLSTFTLSPHLGEEKGRKGGDHQRRPRTGVIVPPRVGRKELKGISNHLYAKRKKSEKAKEQNEKYIGGHHIRGGAKVYVATREFVFYRR